MLIHQWVPALGQGCFYKSLGLNGIRPEEPPHQLRLSSLTRKADLTKEYVRFSSRYDLYFEAHASQWSLDYDPSLELFFSMIQF